MPAISGVDYNNGLGNTNLPAIVNAGGSLFLNNNVSVGLKPLSLNGTGNAFGALAAFGNTSWGGDITLAGDNHDQLFLRREQFDSQAGPSADQAPWPRTEPGQ